MTMPVFVANVKTRRFNYTEVKPHFINPCCFGEDFAAWLALELAPLTAQGFQISQPIQEDYGWGLWVARGKSKIWIALSSLQDGEETADPSSQGEWVVSVQQEFGINPLARLFGGQDPSATSLVSETVRSVLERAADIAVTPE